MNNIFYKTTVVFALLISIFFIGCSSAPFKVVSEPDQAQVFIVDGDQNETLVGTTPLVKKKKEMSEFLRNSNSPGGLVNVVIKKDGFKTKDLMLPINAGGNLGTSLNLTMSPARSSLDEMKTAEGIIHKLFLSQQFARTQQFERALTEIDKIIEEFPKFERAMTMKAAILYAQGTFQESLTWYEKALAVNPDLKNAVEMAAKIRLTLKLPARRIPANTNNSGGN